MQNGWRMVEVREVKVIELMGVEGKPTMLYDPTTEIIYQPYKFNQIKRESDKPDGMA